MKTVQIKDDIFWVGVNDHETTLFEGMWPITHEGVAYNAYVINDEKVAVVDTVKSFKQGEYIEKIKSIIGDKKVDYLIVNHMEPDHSSSIADLLAVYPDMKIIGNAKTFPIMKNFYDIDKNLMEVADGDSLSLGKHELQFYMTPMVHWPESMVTYDATEKLLFSMDVFGSFGNTDAGIFDDEHDLADFEDNTRRYYACIVGKVSGPAQKALQKLGPLDIQMICPSHGLIWRSNVGYIVDFYDRMSRYQTEEGVVIAYGSMYGNTLHSAELLAGYLKEAGVKTVKMYDVSKIDISYIVSDMWKYKGLILGAPAYYGRIFPKMANLLYKIEEIGVKEHKLGFFTDFSWSNGADRYFEGFIKAAKADVVGEMVNVQGYADAEDEAKLKALAEAMAEAVRA